MNSTIVKTMIFVGKTIVIVQTWYNHTTMVQHIDLIRAKALPILKAAGVTRSSLFGSIARGEATATSDIDILVDFPDGKSLLDFIHLKHELEEALGAKVDLVDFETIKPAIRDNIISSQIPLL